MEKILRQGAIVMAVILLAGTLMAAPQVVNYQGRLTDAGGSPVTGTRNMRFQLLNGVTTLYDAGTIPVTVTDGNFTVNLGDAPTPPLDESVFGAPLPAQILRVTVEGEVMSPDVQLTSVPYAIKARMVHTINGATGGTIQGNVVCSGGGGSPVVRVWDWSGGGLGGSVDVFDETGGYTGVLGPNVWGAGGNLYVAGASFGTSFEVQGNGGPGWPSPLAFFSGDSSITIFNTNLKGNNSVELPENSIGASEIVDEPGIARGVDYSGVELAYLTWKDIVSVTITTPAAGYIFLIGQCYIEFDAVSGSGMYAEIQIDEPSGFGDNFDVRVGGGFPGPNVYYDPVSVTRVYYKPAGTYTFVMEGQTAHTNDTKTWAAWPLLNAIYLPTSYGAVETVANLPNDNQSEASQGVNAVAGQTVVEFDLRELELREAEARAEAEKARRILLEARLKAQQSGRQGQLGTAVQVNGDK